ncbi:MAG TPA: MFS transporter [Inquilinus sp.]|nr:MFS transporter [Inquilinus sp.]
MILRAFKGATGKVFILLCLMYFIMYVDRVNLSIAAPLIKGELHLSNTELGLALGAFGYCYALFQIISGYLGDRIGARRMLSISGLFWTGGTVLAGFASGLWTLIGARLLVGIGEAGTIPTATGAISRWVPKVRRGFAQGFTHTSARLAAAVTPPLVVALIPLLGWRGAFVVLGVASFLWVAVWWNYFRDDPREHEGITEAELAELPVLDREVGSRATVPWGRLILRVAPVTLAFFCHAWTLWLYLSWLPSFFVGEYGFDLKDSALLSSIIFVAGMIGDTAGGLLTDWIYRRTGDLNRARRNAMLLGFGCSLVCLSGVLFIQDQILITICLALGLFFLEMTEAPIWSVPLDIAPRYAGIASGFVSTAAGVAALVSPIAFGYILDVTGSYRPPFLISIGLLGLGIVLAFFVRADRPVEAPAEDGRRHAAVLRTSP